MKEYRSRNIAASVRQRLLNIAREQHEDFNLTLSRYASERFLYRLGSSTWKDRFMLKGALLFYLWDTTAHRPTRDIDLLGSGDPDVEEMTRIFRQLCTVAVEDDGIRFDAATVTATPIREDAVYDGIRLHLQGSLESARISLQIDIGFGDVVSPEPLLIDFPTLLEFPAPRLHAYPVYTVIAEKYHAIVLLGIINSRMKDYFDLHTIARTQSLDARLLLHAITATFTRRQSILPDSIPTGLAAGFTADSSKQMQ